MINLFIAKVQLPKKLRRYDSDSGFTQPDQFPTCQIAATPAERNPAPTKILHREGNTTRSVRLRDPATKHTPETGSPPTESLAAAAMVSSNGTPEQARWNQIEYLEGSSIHWLSFVEL